MTNLDEDDLKKIEEIINNAIHKSRIANQRREHRKELKEHPLKRIRLKKEYGLALFAAGFPLLATGILLLLAPIFSQNISINWAFIIGGSVAVVSGLVFMAFAK